MTPEFRKRIFELTEKDLQIPTEEVEKIREKESKENKKEEDKKEEVEEESIVMLKSMGFDEGQIKNAVKRFPHAHQAEDRVEYLLSGAASSYNDTYECGKSILDSDEDTTAPFDLAADLFDNPIEEDNNEEEKKEKRAFLTRMLPSELQKLFCRMMLLDQKSLSTNELTESFGWSRQETSIQHDIHELNRLMFGALENSLRGTSGENIVSELYSIITSDELVCTECGNARKKEEILLDIPLTVGKFTSIEESLRHFVQMEKLEGDNRWECPRCERKVDALKGVKIVQMSPLLILSLQRFEFNMRTLSREKNCEHVSFPFLLDFSEFANSEKKEDLLYDLFGCIVHCGSSANCGHYRGFFKDLSKEGHLTGQTMDVAEEKGESRQVIHDGWYCFDDNLVYAVPQSKVESQFGGKTECAYMLIYRRKNLPMPEKTHPPEYMSKQITQLNENLVLQRMEEEIRINETNFDIFFSEDFQVDSENIPTLNKVGEDHVKPVKVTIDRRKSLSQLISLIKHKSKNFPSPHVLHAIELRGGAVHFVSEVDEKEDRALKEIEPLRFTTKILCWDGETINRQNYALHSRKINLKIDFFQPNPEALEMGQVIHLSFKAPQLFTLRQLREMVCQEICYEEEEPLQILRFDPEKLVLLNEEECMLTQLGLYNGCKLGAESKSTAKNVDKSFCYQAFKERKENIEIFVTNRCATQITSHTVFGSEQMTIGELRQKILSTIFDTPPSQPTRLVRLSKFHSKLEIEIFFLLCQNKTRVNKTGGEGAAFSDETSTVKESGVGDGSVVSLEYGVPPSRGEVEVKVLWGCKNKSILDNPLKLTFPTGSTLAECKQAVMEALKLDGSKQYRLRKTDLWEEPGKIILEEQRTLKESGYRQGDVLWFEEGALPEKGQVELFLELRTLSALKTGVKESLWSSSTLGEPLFVSKASTIAQLKQFILENCGSSSLAPSSHHIRLWSGNKLLKEGSETVKQVHLSNASTLSAQILAQPEVLNNHIILIFLQKRNVRESSFEVVQEFHFKKGQKKMVTTEELSSSLCDFLSVPKEHLYLAKHISSNGRWKELISPYEEAPGLESKGKEERTKKHTPPFYLNDSDIIVWKDTREDPENKDNFIHKIDSFISQQRSVYRGGKVSDFPREEVMKIDLIYK